MGLTVILKCDICFSTNTYIPHTFECFNEKNGWGYVQDSIGRFVCPECDNKKDR